MVVWVFFVFIIIINFAVSHHQHEKKKKINSIVLKMEYSDVWQDPAPDWAKNKKNFWEVSERIWKEWWLTHDE